MLKFFRLSAALAAIFSTQLTSSLLATQANAANQSVSASTSTLVVTNETINERAEVTDTSIFVADSSINTPEVAEKVGSAGVVLGLAAVGGGAVGVILSARKIKNSLKPSSVLSPKSSEDDIRIDQASRKLQQKLLRLLHDDRDTANRLLSQVKIKNPNRSNDWYVEKVIYDLERDRGSY